MLLQGWRDILILSRCNFFRKDFGHVLRKSRCLMINIIQLNSLILLLHYRLGWVQDLTQAFLHRLHKIHRNLRLLLWIDWRWWNFLLAVLLLDILAWIFQYFRFAIVGILKRIFLPAIQLAIVDILHILL